MNIVKKVKRENELWSIMRHGYSRGMAISWRKAVMTFIGADTCRRALRHMTCSMIGRTSM